MGANYLTKIEASPDFQDFSFSKRYVPLWITNLVPEEDPSRWCGFIEVEGWGRDKPWLVGMVGLILKFPVNLVRISRADSIMLWAASKASGRRADI